MKKYLRLNFLLISFLLLSGFLISCKKEVKKSLSLSSSSTTITFDYQTGSLLQLTHKASGQEFVSNDNIRPLFKLTLTQPYEKKSLDISAEEFRKVKIYHKKPDKLELIFSKHESLPLSVKVIATADEEGLIRMRLNINNTGDWSIASTQFPRFVSPAQLGSSSSDDRLLATGWSGHVLIEAPGSKTHTLTALYPQSMNSQFAALYDEVAGLYMATYDTTGHYKKWNVLMKKDQLIEMQLIHLNPEVPVSEFELPYDIVLSTFTGDWYDAADIYKRWTIQQNWCARKISQRNDIPEFFKSGAALLCIPFLHEIVDYKLFPFEIMPQLPEIASIYQKRTELKHIGFVPFGWENRGAWTGINYFPAIPSNEAWQTLSEELRKQGNFIFMMPSGFAWVVKRKESRSGPAFDDSADYEQRKEMTVHNADGTPYLLDAYTNPKDWKGLTARLCHSSPETSKAILDIFLGIAKLGTSVIQFDQSHGGSQREPCYSTTHGHLPGYTNQYWNDFRNISLNILKEGRLIRPELGLSIESCSELAIPIMSTMWGRQTYEMDAFRLGMRGVGVFSYLYHEYIPVLGDGFSIGHGMTGTLGSAELRCYRLAKTLAHGLIPTVYMERAALEPKDEWHKTVSQAFFSYCRPYSRFQEYLLLGSTRRPPVIECDDQDLWLFQADELGEILPDGRKAVKEIIRRPTVVAGSFDAEDGSNGTIIINTTGKQQQAKIKLISGTHSATLFQADRTIENQWNNAPDEVIVNLEPFGVRMLILSSK